ncbi:MAG: T9SS type A sorting domain-containing protein [Chitinophagales bacterium]
MWSGIYCHGSTNITTITNTNIYDATTGLYFFDRNQFRVSNSIFDRNLYDISIWDGSGNPAPYPGSISGCTFECTGYLYWPYTSEHTWTGITVGGVSGTNTGGMFIGVGGLPNNVYDGIQVGIVVSQSTVNVSKENIFQNIVNNIPTNFGIQRGYAINCGGSSSNFLILNGWGNAINSTVNFSNCTYGVNLSGMNCTIQNNFMSNVNYGISAFNCNGDKLDILTNRINNEITGTFSISKGIQITNCIGASLSIVGNYLKVCENSVFNSGSVGIDYFDNGTQNLQSYIANNSISLHYAGAAIHAVNINGTEIFNNSIYLYKTNSIYGLSIQNGNYLNVHCNSVNPNFNISLSAKRGLNFDATTNSTIQCNSASYTTKDISFYNASGGNNFLTNTMGKSNYGLYLSNGASLGTQTDKGNLWGQANIYNTYGAYAANNLTIFVAPTGYPYTPPSYTNTTIQFFPSTNPQPNCDNAGCNVIGPALRLSDVGSDSSLSEPPNEITSMDTLIASGDVSYAAGDSAAIWMDQKYLYEKIHENSLLIDTNQVMHDFFLENQSSNIAAFTTVHDSLAKSFSFENNYLSLSVTDLGISLINVQSSYDSIVNQLLDSIVNLNIADSLTTLKIELSNEMINIQTQLDSLNVLMDSLYKIKINGVSLLNSNISNTQEIYDANQKSVNNIYLYTIALGIDSLNSNDFSILSSIANQCPHLGGPSVFTARYMVSYYDHISSFNDSILCEGVNERYAYKGNIAFKPFCKIYPNPASNTIIITYQLQNNQSAVIIITDLLGTVVKTVNLPIDYYAISTDISLLQHGVYLFRMLGTDGKNTSGKFTKF